MEKGALLQCIEGYCCKELKAVDCNFEKSNQHEFNVNKEMKKTRFFINAPFLISYSIFFYMCSLCINYFQ